MGIKQSGVTGQQPHPIRPDALDGTQHLSRTSVVGRRHVDIGAKRRKPLFVLTTRLETSLGVLP